MGQTRKSCTVLDIVSHPLPLKLFSKNREGTYGKEIKDLTFKSDTFLKCHYHYCGTVTEKKIITIGQMHPLDFLLITVE